MRLFIETTKSQVHRKLREGFTQADDRDEYQQFYGVDGLHLEDEITASKPTSVVVEVDAQMSSQQVEQWELFLTDTYNRHFFLPIAFLNSCPRKQVNPSLVRRWIRWVERRPLIP